MVSFTLRPFYFQIMDSEPTWMGSQVFIVYEMVLLLVLAVFTAPSVGTVSSIDLLVFMAAFWLSSTCIRVCCGGC
jgi:hypothetical protein